jgi:nitroimidazol reductase NimA-like FMN-containing flavoprotein (pyridoxamine 5'-phosphate oxidase superfamily)
MATIDSQGYPYITPVNFVLMQGNIYFHCAPKGEKLDNLAREERVCFEVDVPLAYVEVGFNEEKNPCRTHQLYHSVVIRGRARVLEDGEAKTKALNALVAKHEGGREFPPVTPDSPAFKGCRVVEITPEMVSGKSDLIQGKPEEVRRALAESLLGRGLPGDIQAVKDMGFELAGGPDQGWSLKG